MAEPNWANKTVFTGDNLHIMRGMNSESVDLIYLDPPFNSKKDYAAPIGSQAAGAEFSDTWTLRDVDAEWINLIEDKHPALHRVLLAAMTDSDKSYLAYMAARLLEAHRVLDTHGSLFLHCDPTMSHYLKLLLDAIFGRGQCRNEIIWCYTGPGSPKMRQFNRKHDTIFWFAKGDEWTFNGDDVRMPYKDPKQRPRRVFDTGGHFDKEAIDEMRARGKVPETWWTDIAIVARSKTERVGYPTQKPLKLLSRIIKAATPPPRRCVRSVLRVCDGDGRCRRPRPSVGRDRLVTEGSAARRATDRRAARAVRGHHRPHRHTAAHRPRHAAPLQLPREPRDAVRRAGRALCGLP